MKALVLGCGSIGFRHIGHLRKLGVSEIEAADPNPEARERVHRELGLAVGSDPEKALSGRPDIVLVCTPASTHIPMALRALAAGAHVFVEKPLSTGLREIRPLADAVAINGRVLQVGYNLRYHPAMRRAKEVLGGKACIAGNVPIALLTVGTPDDVRAYCKDLIDTVAGDGGFILGASGQTEDVKIENVKAMVDFTKEYGVY